MFDPDRISQEYAEMLALEYVRMHVTKDSPPGDYITLFFQALDGFEAASQESPSPRKGS